ncbi:FAD/NAD(P)-binding domain-containing protein [Eremomyces bilateralis CBS 781.70]|uniref:FAD/NAD(P)-binding domain-containing protein n=1 Tax=Eremomyces bilateralis CBS 781.70 TaxID=1392243 RepID=A0A6G1FRR6_9PEZI|nr:FAD/NAD(P)-binding domain-containing protein [Eremomyces bilateralis CBS 781.70]KAF1808473.1 FAD/NAD(P)-binding domain-containing protein [Eremomyces bilateralis CBS 781.70]
MAASEKDSRPFRAIIVGGGIAGLFMAHALEAAGIDYVLLERALEPVEERGAGFGLWPQNFRVVDQLGMLEDIEKLGSEFKWTYNFNPDGSPVANASNNFEKLTQRAGYGFTIFRRSEFLRGVYDKLPNKSKFVTGMALERIEQDDKGVKVFLKDGSMEAGDIVIGTDGVHSQVREFMWKHANGVRPGAIPAQEKMSFTSEYRCLYGVSKMVPGLQKSSLIDCNDKHCNWLLFSCEDRIFWLFFEKLGKSFNCQNCHRYSESDAVAVGEKYLSHPINGTVMWRDIWENRIQYHLGPIEEGVLNQWHFGRIVLAGDSAHKMTPNLGYGGNQGIESVVVLANGLNRLIKRCETVGRRPSTEELSAVFDEYKEIRYPRAKKHHDLTGYITRFDAYDGFMYPTLQWLMPRITGKEYMINLFVELVRPGRKLDFLDERVRRRGTMKWEDELTMDEKKQLQGRTMSKSVLFGIAGAAGTVVMASCLYHGISPLPGFHV